MSDAIDDLLEANRAARAELLEAVDAIPPGRRSEGWFGDDRWSVHDLIAHITAWQDGWAHALELMARGERPAVPGYEGDIDAFNGEAVRGRRDRTWEELMAGLRAARERHEAAMLGLRGRLAPERLEPGRTARTISDTAEHDREHASAILDWRREQGL